MSSDTHPSTFIVPIKKLHPAALTPSQASTHDAGYDLYCLERFTLGIGVIQLVKTGIAVAIPEGHVGYIKPRSGLALRHGIDVLGGVIDSGYRGEVGVILTNLGQNQVHFDASDRIAQLVIQPLAKAGFVEVEALPGSQRGAGGFGSTGA